MPTTTEGQQAYHRAVGVGKCFTKSISPLVAQTEDFLSDKLREIHVSRMKFYDNAFLGVNKISQTK